MDIPQPGFVDLGLSDALVEVLDKLGYEEPTAIQSAAIPVALTGRDVLGQAATGTGKTAAFALPLLQRLADPGNRPATPSALILVPTRELAMQVSEALHTYGRAVDARVLPVFGGQPIFRQLKALSAGIDIVVATPGRAVDHIARGSLDLSGLSAIVLDEADEMLDMGFADELNTILERVPAERQTLLFSATLAPRIARLAEKHMTDPVRIQIDSDDPEGADSPSIREVAHVVTRHHKATALARILDVEQPTATIVFCRTRHDVDHLTETMNGRGYRAEALHGGMTQDQRDRVMNRLRAGTAELLIATDVAARGLDVDILTHVVNHSLPQAAAAYVHRIGRVGRAGREGVAITFVEPREHRALAGIERHTGRKIPREPIPTVADLRERRLGMLQATIRETILEEAERMDGMRPIVDALSEEFDPIQIALAALRVAQDESVGRDDEEEEPEVPVEDLQKDGGGHKGSKGPKGGNPTKGAWKTADLPDDSTRLWVSSGREGGVRPKDLVGAIANETSLTGRDVGSIQIAERFSLVDVPTRAVAEVTAALQRTTIRGRKVKVRRDNSKS